MKTVKYIYLVAIVLLIFANYALSIPKFSDNKSKTEADPIYNKTIMIPQGYTLNVSLKEKLSCDDISISDNINVILNNDFIYKGIVIAPEGSIINGKIIRKIAENNNCKVKSLFTNIITTEGTNIPISALFVGQNKNGYIISDKDSGLFNIIHTDIIIKQPITYIKK